MAFSPRAQTHKKVLESLGKLTQVANHSILVVWSAVVLVEGIEDAPRAWQTLGEVPIYLNSNAVSTLGIKGISRKRLRLEWLCRLRNTVEESVTRKFYNSIENFADHQSAR